MTVVGQREPTRPPCSRHPGSRIRLDGYVHCAWSPAHRRPRYRCVTEPGSRGHAFSLPVAVRQPTEHHPDSGQACPRCEHVCERHEGVKTGRDFVFGHQEIARLFLRLGEGMSLREASAELRRSIFRTDAEGAASRAANLAVNYLDAFAPAVLEALLPKVWPTVVVIDSTTLMTRGYRPRRRSGDETEEPDATGDAAETRVGNLKAGTIMLAFDGSLRQPQPCLIQVQGGKDADSWKAFFASLAGAPDWVVADLDPAIGRAARESWPGAVLIPSRHHVAELMRERARADGVDERIELSEPIALRRPVAWAPGRTTHRYGEHPLFTAIDVAQRGTDEWQRLKALVEEHVPADRLALRSWIVTHEPWETRVADRTARPSFCPYHMGNRVHPAESLAAYYPWLAREWHPTANELRPHEVSRASAREVAWRCEHGHEWRAVVYARTLSGSGCPACYRIEASLRSKAGKQRARQERDAAATHAVESRLRAAP